MANFHRLSGDDELLNDERDRAVFELTPEERARAEAQFERELAQLGDADPELRASVIESHRRTMAMTWEERRDRMTADESWRERLPRR